MLSLLRSEWYQVRKMLSVKITFAITLVASVVFGFHMTSGAYLEEYKRLDQMYILFGGGSLRSTMSDGAAGLLFASLFAGWMISGGFENRTIQEAISYGKSRTKVYFAKMFQFLMVVTGLCLVYWFGSSLASFLRHGLGTVEVVGNLCHVEYIVGMVFAGILAYISLFSLCGLVGFLNRKVGATMGICFVAILFGGNLLASVVPESVITVINHTPLGLYNQVLKLDVQWADIGRTSLLSLLWIGMICGIGLWRFQRTELK